MFIQLVERIAAGDAASAPGASTATAGSDALDAVILAADPLDLMLHMEQVWDAFDPWKPEPRPAGPARRTRWTTGAFAHFEPEAGPAWHHLAYAFMLENTRAVQILQRVVRLYRSGESLGVPSVATQRWLDAAEVILGGEVMPMAHWPSSHPPARDPEAGRRNAYWRLFGMELAFGAEDNSPAAYEKAEQHNADFVPLFEELLRQISRVLDAGSSDDGSMVRAAAQLRDRLLARRQGQQLARQELAASTALGWADLTLRTNTSVVKDLGAHADSAADRLRGMGERVGLAAHARSAALIPLATGISAFLRAVESGALAESLLGGPADSAPARTSRQVIQYWTAATGHVL